MDERVGLKGHGLVLTETPGARMICWLRGGKYILPGVVDPAVLGCCRDCSFGPLPTLLFVCGTCFLLSRPTSSLPLPMLLLFVARVFNSCVNSVVEALCWKATIESAKWPCAGRLP